MNLAFLKYKTLEKPKYVSDLNLPCIQIQLKHDNVVSNSEFYDFLHDNYLIIHFLHFANHFLVQESILTNGLFVFFI